MRILHFGDLHVWRMSSAPDFWYPKRTLGSLNLAFHRRHHFPPKLGQACMEAIAEQEADVVIFSGDMSTMSLESEFEAAARLFDPLREKWGDRLFVIPGNHDRYTPRSVRLGLYEKYFPEGAFGEGQRVRTITHDGIAISGFDASRPFAFRSNGLLDETLVSELDDELTRLGKDATPVILVGHFPYTYPGGVEGKWNHRLLRDDRLAELIAKHQPLAYLHGHKHQRWALRDSRAPGTLAINSGPAGMKSDDPFKQAGWVTFEVEKEEVSQVRAHHLDVEGQAQQNPLSN